MQTAGQCFGPFGCDFIRFPAFGRQKLSTVFQRQFMPPSTGTVVGEAPVQLGVIELFTICGQIFLEYDVHDLQQKLLHKFSLVQ